MKLKNLHIDSPANRVKQARIMTGATRNDFQEKFGINSNTLQAWENGRNPISDESARKLSSVFARLGICVSEHWLISGEGRKPYFLDNSNITLTNVFAQADMKTGLVEEEKIIAESLLFQSHYTNTKVVVVSDNSMAPIYNIGDYVGGFLYTGEEISIALGYNSIIVSTDGEVYFRKFLQTDVEGKYLLSAVNPHVKDVSPLIYLNNVVGVAPVIWHRKKHPLSSSE